MEELLLEVLAKCLIGFGVLTALSSLFTIAPYGRFSTGKGLTVNAKLAWFLQEFPSFALPVYFLWISSESGFSINKLLLCYFIFHYFHRFLIYSLLISGGKPSPLHIVVSSTFFCTYNGYLQGAFFTKYLNLPFDHIFSASFLLGTTIFFSGMAVNIHSDHILRNLRKPGETGYKIPKGGAFQYVSAGNYFGEIVEWWGLAIASSFALPPMSFAIFTTLFLGSRGYHNHQWYRSKFPNYPKSRKAVIPYIF